jgi:hypothetical protein
MGRDVIVRFPRGWIWGPPLLGILTQVQSGRVLSVTNAPADLVAVAGLPMMDTVHPTAAPQSRIDGDLTVVDGRCGYPYRQPHVASLKANPCLFS